MRSLGMDSRKRKAAAVGLERRVRARAEPEPESDEFEDFSSIDGNQNRLASGEGSEDEATNEEDSSSEEVEIITKRPDTRHEPVADEDVSDEGDGSASDSEDEADAVDAAKLSFGSLAKAQESFSASSKSRTKRRHGSDDASSNSGSDSEDEAVKKEYRPWLIKQPNSRSKPDVSSRASKHAPTEMTSKRPVSRKREVVSTAGHARAKARDPRFDATIQGSSHPSSSTYTSRHSRAGAYGGAANGSAPRDAQAEAHARKAYSFLDTYREDEIRALKASISAATKKPSKRNPSKTDRSLQNLPAHKIEEMKRTLASMESRKSAQHRKDRERDIITEQRRKERDLVSAGVKERPFYMKRKDVKDVLRKERDEGMSEKQVEKRDARREKKIAGREIKRGFGVERRIG